MTVSLVMWLSTCPTSILRTNAPSSRRRSCWPKILWSRSIMLLLLWFFVWSSMMRSLLMWCREYRSSRYITVLRSLSNWCLMLQCFGWVMSCLLGRSPALTPTIDLFLSNEGLLNYIVQHPRHQYPHFRTNVEVEVEHKLVNF
jgi:hypothetical protein